MTHPFWPTNLRDLIEPILFASQKPGRNKLDVMKVAEKALDVDAINSRFAQYLNNPQFQVKAELKATPWNMGFDFETIRPNGGSEKFYWEVFTTEKERKHRGRMGHLFIDKLDKQLDDSSMFERVLFYILVVSYLGDEQAVEKLKIYYHATPQQWQLACNMWDRDRFLFISWDMISNAFT